MPKLFALRTTAATFSTLFIYFRETYNILKDNYSIKETVAMIENWVETEFQSADLGDQRLNKRLRIVEYRHPID